MGEADSQKWLTRACAYIFIFRALIALHGWGRSTWVRNTNPVLPYTNQQKIDKMKAPLPSSEGWPTFLLLRVRAQPLEDGSPNTGCVFTFTLISSWHKARLKTSWLLLFKFFLFVYFLRQDLCSPGWPWTFGNVPASVSGYCDYKCMSTRLPGFSLFFLNWN